jgi:hypothetical protein
MESTIRRFRIAELSPPPLVVAFELSERRKSIVADGLAGASAIIYLAELDGAARAEALRNAGALLTHNTATDLRSSEARAITSSKYAVVVSMVIGALPVLVSDGTESDAPASSP